MSNKIKEKIDMSIGSIHESNNYGSFKILGLDHITKRHSKYYRIHFLKTGYETVAAANHIKSGMVRDPFYPRIYGIAYLGFEKLPAECERDVKRWYSMIDRCYNLNCHDYSTYGALGVTVCERWLCFKNYYEDMPYIPGREDYLNDPDNYQLDKDILQQGVPKYLQVYSPETCMFVHRGLNVAYRNNTGTNNNAGYYGVYEYHNNNNYSAQIYYNGINRIIGIYSNPELAAGVYNQFVLSHMLNKPLNPVSVVTQAQVYDYNLRNGNKIEMCKIVDKSKPKEMCRIVDPNKYPYYRQW